MCETVKDECHGQLDQAGGDVDGELVGEVKLLLSVFTLAGQCE